MATALRYVIVLAVVTAASPSLGESDSSDTPLATVRFDPGGDGVVIPALVDGKVANLLLDTGATVSSVDTSFRALLGSPVRRHAIHTPDGASSEVEVFSAPEMKLGTMPIDGVKEIVCLDCSRFREHGLDMQGFIGMDFLQRHVVRLDYDRGEVSFLRVAPANPGSAVNLGLTSRGIPTLTLSVGGLGRRSFLIDTGTVTATSGDMDSPSIDRLLAKGEATLINKSQFLTQLSVADCREIQVDEVTLESFQHSKLVFGEMPANNVVGLHYLSRYIVTFDFPHMKMYLKPGLRFRDPDEIDLNLSGASIARLSGKTTVLRVKKNGSARAAGLAPGDTIIAIDGKQAASLPLAKIRKTLSSAGKHRLRVARGADEMEIALEVVPPEQR